MKTEKTSELLVRDEMRPYINNLIRNWREQSEIPSENDLKSLTADEAEAVALACGSTQKGKPTPKATITIRRLNSDYGPHAVHLLEEYLEQLERQEGTMRSYRILKELPGKQEYIEIRKERYTSTVADLVDSAFTDFEDLAAEVGEWYDGLPENFQVGDKGCALEDAQNTLDSLSQPDVSEDIGALPVYYLPLINNRSRASRRDDAVGRLQAVVDALEESANDEGIRCLTDELENAISEAGGVEFPGMY